MNAHQRERMEQRRQRHLEQIRHLSGSTTPMPTAPSSRTTTPHQSQPRHHSRGDSHLSDAQERGRAMIEQMQRNPGSVPNSFTVPSELMGEFPVALPTRLGKHLQAVVEGTAIIDRSNVDDHFEDVLEVVSIPRSMTEERANPLGPDLDLYGDHASAQPRLSVSYASVEEMRRESSLHVFDLIPSDEDNNVDDDNDVVGTSMNLRRSPGVQRTVSISSVSEGGGGGHRVLISPTAMQHEPPRHVLRHGGGVIFSDQFIHSHPDSGIANVTHDFQLSAASYSQSEGNPLVAELSTPSATPSLTPPRHPHEYINQVETQQRPLFRRVDSKRMYGRGVYHSAADHGGSSESIDGHPLRDRRESDKSDGCTDDISQECYLRSATTPIPDERRSVAGTPRKAVNGHSIGCLAQTSTVKT